MGREKLKDVPNVLKPLYRSNEIMSGCGRHWEGAEQCAVPSFVISSAFHSCGICQYPRF